MTLLTLLVTPSDYASSTLPENFDALTADSVQRFAFDTTFNTAEISNKNGPMADGKFELIDAYEVPVKFIPSSAYKRIIVARQQLARDFDGIKANKAAVQLAGYMDVHTTAQVATASVRLMDVGQALYGKWSTVVYMQLEDGTWIHRNLSFLSALPSVDGTYGLLLNGRLASVPANSFVETLLDDTKIDSALAGGHYLGSDSETSYLLRTPAMMGGAFNVVNSGLQMVLDANFKMIGTVINTGTEGMFIAAINSDGTEIEAVTKVARMDDTWDIATAIEVGALPEGIQKIFAPRVS